MAHGKGSVGAERIVALATAREPSRSKTELYSCLALLFGAVATLTAVITYLAIAPGASVAPSNLTGARSLLASLGLATSVLAFFSARLLLCVVPRAGGRGPSATHTPRDARSVGARSTRS